MLPSHPITQKTFHIIYLFCFITLISTSVNGQGFDSPDSKSVTYPSFTFGGEVRARVRALDGINFGDNTANTDAYLNLRGYLYGYLGINNNIGLHAQLLSATTLGKNDISASDEDLLAVGELYADILTGLLPVQLRIGRQPLGFGSGRLIGASDGPNVAKKYDGLRATVTMGNSTGDFMIASIVDYRQGLVDDRIGRDKIVYGGYWTFGITGNKSLDVCFFGNSLKDVAFQETVADENRYSIGSRFVKTGSFDIEVEAVTQFGFLGDQKISAYMLSASAGYYWEETILKPSVKLSGSIYSGKRDSTDNKIEIFRPVYARPPVNFMAPFGSSNIILLVPEGSIEITPELKATLRYYLVWRLFRNDGLYNNQLSSLVRCSDTISDEKGLFVTDGFNLSLAYNITDNLNVGFTGGYFFPGKYICNTGAGQTEKAGFVTISSSF